MLHIYYGRECVDKEKFIFDRIRASAAAGSGNTPAAAACNPRALLIVPDQYTFEMEQRSLQHLEVEGLMDMEVLSMSRLGSRLLSELGGQKQTFIDKYGRHMILSRVAREEKANLQVLRGLEERNSFIEMVNNFISEMKQYNCGIAELRAMAEETGGAEGEGSYTRRKLLDLALLYERYEKEIEGKYTDSEDYIDLYLSKIQRSELIRDNQVWIHGFDSFAPKALSVIGQLSARAADVNVVLTWDRDCRDEELFTLTGIVMDNLEAMAAAVGVESRRHWIPAAYGRGDLEAYGRGNLANRVDGQPDPEPEMETETSPAIAHIERELYALPAGTCENHKGVHLVSAAGFYNEAESAAAYILHLVREKGLKYRDIRVICNDQENRGPIIERVFQEYGLEIFSDSKRDILSSPVVQYILALLDTVLEGWRTEDLFRVLKSGFGPLPGDEVTDLENYAIKYRVRRSMWKRAFVKGASEYGEDGLARLEEIRQRAVQPVLALEPLVKGCRASEAAGPGAADPRTEDAGSRTAGGGSWAEGSDGDSAEVVAAASASAAGTSAGGAAPVTMADFIYAFYRYLYETVKLPDQILAFMARQEELGRVDLADETSQIWGRVIGILDQMIEIMGTEDFDGQVFLDIFRVGLSQVEIGMLPPTRDGLVMGTMQRTRMSSVKALVIIGANEGVLPQEKPAAGLFSSEEKDLFREKGTELCKVDSIVLMEERLAIYRNLSKPGRYLWISCALADGEGKACKPSSVYLKIKELFPDLREERDVLNQQNPLPLVHSGVSGLRHLTEALQDLADGVSGAGSCGAPGRLPAAWEAALSWYQRERPEALTMIRDGLAFTNSQERLGRQAVRQLYLRNPEGAISISPSRLERFSRCPFSHFVAYGLRPEERRIFEIAPREIGDIYHECLMTLTRTLTREDLDVTHPMSPWMTVTRQQCRALVEETARQQMAGYKEGLFHQGKEENYRSQRIIDICDKVCWTVVEQVRAGQILENGFEVGFHRGGQIPPIEIQIGRPARTVGEGAAEGRADAGGAAGGDDTVRAAGEGGTDASGTAEEGGTGEAAGAGDGADRADAGPVETVYIEGKIDRVDYLPGDRVKIIDYKTGNENFSVKEAKAGYRLQLMLYLKAACQSERRPAGVFYFKISEPALDATGKEWDQEELEKEIRKSFKLNGIMVDDPQVIESIAGDFSGYSDIVPLRAGKDKISGTGKETLLSEEDFAALTDAVSEKVRELCENLVDGAIDIHPMKTRERSVCTFCQYRGICRFDTVFAGCSYEII